MWTTIRTPYWLARIVFLVGVVSLVSSLLPGFRDRTRIINDLVPSVFPAAAATGSAAVGIVLILLARALRRGKYRAWLYATLLTALTVGLHVVKGFDIEEATLSLVLLVLLATSRANFTARPDPRSLKNLVGVLLVGPVVATGLGWGWLAVDAHGEAHGTTQGQRIAHAFLGLMGINGPVHFVDHAHDARAAVALVVLGASVLVVAVLAAFQPAGGPHGLTDDEQARVAALVEQWGGDDSLAYFTLRDDRSVLFSPNGRAAITYRVVGTVSLVAADPVGAVDAWPAAIDAWLAEARSYGWTPGVLGASERAAEYYHRAGLNTLEIGDEAIVHVPDFTLEGRSMRGVRQAITRCERAGLKVTCHRVRDLGPEQVELIRDKAEEWRNGASERGFSMALGSFGPEAAPDAVIALSHGEDGELHGLLHFVPWGQDGLSLDLMRRDRSSENGIIEQLVAGVVQAAPEFGVVRVSLNFAAFRSVFARGERLGAGPVLRLWRGILLYLSRFWQIESLYRSNSKYRPEWVPRFLCFRSSSDIPGVGVAALRAEALVEAPKFAQRLARL